MAVVRFAALVIVAALALPNPASAASRDEINAVVDASPCPATNWNDRGRATRGYIRGMAIMFAKSACRIGDPDVAVVAATPIPAKIKTDAMAFYRPIFAAKGLSNDTAGVEVLRHSYALLIGLGMRESSGQHCVGRDLSANFTTADSAEAGLFQTSWGVNKAHPTLKALFEAYRQGGRACELETFAKTVKCSAADARNWGEGIGHDWQVLTKACPAFATEYAAVVLRTSGGSRGEFGPIRNQKAEVAPQCDAMLAKVQELTEQPGFCAGLQ